MRVGGIAKGSGMIHPNMATMLCVITSDANAAPELWREVVRRGSINSFNQVYGRISLNTYLFYIQLLLQTSPRHAASSAYQLLRTQEGCGLQPCWSLSLSGAV